MLPPIVLAASLMLALLGACTTTNIPISTEQLPEVNATPVAAPQQNDQVLRDTILNGKFSSNSYEEQSGATQMLVISTGGPYLFEIDHLVDRRELVPDEATVINYDTSAPGEYTMHAYLSTPEGTSSEAATATLYITPVGGRY
jgi:hypothetical protein